MIWFTSDLHFGHNNIIDYCGRPFHDEWVDVWGGELLRSRVENMNETLIANWNRSVRDDDTVYVVGDFAMGKIAESLPLAAQLNGRKVLVAGNHDRCWSGNGTKNVNKFLPEYEKYFAEIHEALTIPELPNALICHFPFEGDSQEVDRHADFRPRDVGQWLVHGHVHDEWRRNGRQINVGVDVWNYQPVPLETIQGMMRGVYQ